MAVRVELKTPLAEALDAVIQSKLVEVGWSTGEEDGSPLSEYIILMLVNGKSQQAIATELSGELLGLGSDDPGAIEFSRWLFEQLEELSTRLGVGSGQVAQAEGDHPHTEAVQQSVEGADGQFAEQGQRISVHEGDTEMGGFEGTSQEPKM